MIQEPAASLPPLHEVITFYSYKGGTGRTMALANIACLMGRQFGAAGRVLLIDWDLEAPGLHYYMQPPSAQHAGVVELFELIDRRLTESQRQDDAESIAEQLVDSLPLEDFVQATRAPNVEVMSAGYIDSSYQSRLARIDWERIYERCPAIYRTLARRLSRDYAAVLIDSRTGLTDISSICTALLPDKLVVVFTPNQQSLTGIEDLVRRSTEYRQGSTDLRPLMIYPLASRIDNQFDSLRTLWRNGNDQLKMEGFEKQFERILQRAYALEQCRLFDYFEEVQVQHSPEHSYGESIAVLDAGNTDRFSIVRSYQSLVDWLCSSAAPWERPEHARKRQRLEYLQGILLGPASATSRNDIQARKQLDELLSLSQQVHGPLHRDTLRAQQQLIEAALPHRKERIRAIKMLHELAQLCPKLAGPLRLQLMEFLLGAAGTLRRLDADGDAEDIYMTTIRTLDDDLFVKDVASITDMAARLSTASNTPEAAALVERALERVRSALGPDHESAQQLIAKLGELYLHMGDYSHARPLLEQALAYSRGKAGEHAPETVLIGDNLGQVLINEGDVEAAQAVQSHVIATSKEVFGADHANTFNAMINFGTALRADRKFDAANHTLREALEMTGQQLGPSHPTTLHAMRELATTLEQQGERDEALKLYRTALATARSINDSALQSDLLQRISLMHSMERELR